MARRPRASEADAHEDPRPEWLLTYRQSDWELPEDAERVAALGRDWGSESFARRIVADGRYSDARREWATDHGLTLREL